MSGSLCFDLSLSPAGSAPLLYIVDFTDWKDDDPPSQDDLRYDAFKLESRPEAISGGRSSFEHKATLDRGDAACLE